MSVDMQVQMRRNVEQMHSTVDDLDGWLGDIGKRDASLRGKAAPTGGRPGTTAADEETDEEEEAREIEAAKEELRKAAAEHEAAATAAAPATAGAGADGATKRKSKGPLTHAQKYGQWDQYDADSVVAEIEEREADQERLRKEVVRLENQRAQSKARKAAAVAAAAADALRLKGNEAFGAAQYEEAVGLYTDALGHTPRSAALYANRALALLKLHAHAEAEEDCDAALLIDGGNVKALLRRAQARHADAKYDGALDDLELALELEPRNSAARALMSECRRLKVLAAPRPTVPLERVAVDEVEHDPDNDNDAFVLALAPPTTEAEDASPDATPSAMAGVDGTGAAAAAGGGGGKAESGEQKPSASAAAGGSSAAAAGRARAVPSATPTAESFALPTSLAEFERGWRSLRGQPEQFAAWVGRVEPSSMVALFKNSLPADLFSAILAALDSYLSLRDPARTLAVLRALTQAGRFTILTMCIDKADRKAIDALNLKLIEAQGRGEIAAEEDLAALRKAYA